MAGGEGPGERGYGSTIYVIEYGNICINAKIQTIVHQICKINRPVRMIKTQQIHVIVDGPSFSMEILVQYFPR